MQLKTLKINNLRNIKSANIELDPGLNFLVGDNGAGKTSVLEAIVVLAKGRSFRAGQIVALIGPESEQFRAVATTRVFQPKRTDTGYRKVEKYLESPKKRRGRQTTQ